MIFPLKAGSNKATVTGTATQRIDGITRFCIKPKVDTFPLIQSMVVVTSPIGDQAPPAFAAITARDTNQILSSFVGTNFRSKETSTIVAARLSKVAERKNARIEIKISMVLFLVVLILFVITANPL